MAKKVKTLELWMTRKEAKELLKLLNNNATNLALSSIYYRLEELLKEPKKP